MKIRNGFVSNSSSSSFICVVNSNNKVIPEKHELFIDNEYKIGEHNTGEYQFGWQTSVYNDVISKINFSYIQAKILEEKGNSEPIKMLEELLTDIYKIDKIKWTNIDAFYIDHASSAEEDRNCEMFESKESLMNFIFDSGSYIDNDNDNREDYY